VDVAEAYRLISDEGTAVIVATWEPHREKVHALLKAVSRDPSRANFRALVPYQINLRFHEMYKARTSIVPISERIDSPVWYGEYDSDLGFNPEAADSLLLV
jgi:hypothetical protein